jgi:hypothetical protein
MHGAAAVLVDGKLLARGTYNIDFSLSIESSEILACPVSSKLPCRLVGNDLNREKRYTE